LSTDKVEEDRKSEGEVSASNISPQSRTSPSLRVRPISPRITPTNLRRPPDPVGTIPRVFEAYDGPPPSTTPLQAATPLLFVCDECWRTLSDGSELSCACERPRPAEGWPAMPYLLRGRYLFVELLGRGGMGAVFRAYDQASKDRPWVALKVIQKGTPELQSSLTELFRREVAAAQMLAQHKQFFVDVLGFDDVAPAYLALEYVPWQTLADLVASLPAIERRLPPAQVARIGIAISRGVAKMHFHRIVHRDLTPSNIFVRNVPEREGYDVKISDLGLWAFDQVQGESDSLSLVGLHGTAGTPAYMSPEQSTGEPISGASDLHTIGSVLWELATGELPFPVSKTGLAHEIIEKRARSLRNLPTRPASMPEGLYRILIKALAYDREERWASAGEMRKALEAFVELYQRDLLRDVEDARRRIEQLARNVNSLRDKLSPMREVFERLSNLGAILHEALEQRAEAEPAALRTIADNTAVQLDEITGELGALAEWLRVLGRTKSAPVPSERPSRRGHAEKTEAEIAKPASTRTDLRVHLLWALGLVLVAIVIALFVSRARG